MAAYTVDAITSPSTNAKPYTLIPTQCPLGGRGEFDVELYPATFDPSHLTANTFSPRRQPDRVHYRMVRNTQTGCVRADPVLDPESIQRLYGKSQVSSAKVSHYAVATYIKYLRHVLARLPDKSTILEIGCGRGEFLSAMLDNGIQQVRGIELSSEAASQAAPEVRPYVSTEPLQPGQFGSQSFSLICGFQVLDHLSDPNAVLQICKDILCPQGIMYWICHDIRSIFARLLGERCPMIDIQHIILYDKHTIRRLFEQNGFEVLKVFSVWNRYPISYWTSLAPMPSSVKKPLLSVLEKTGSGRIPLKANFGNMGVVARKGD